MKKRILNYAISATHDLIENLANINDAPSLSDFDAFVYDPFRLQQHTISADSFYRRQRELRDLVVMKGGIVLCLLRGINQLGFNGLDSYSVLESTASNLVLHMRTTLRPGWGSRIDLIAGAKGAAVGYFRILRDALRFAAYLETTSDNLKPLNATVLGVDSVSHPVGFEVAVGAGRLCFLPIPENVEGNRVGSAIVRVVEAHYGGPGEIEKPSWVEGVGVPGATADDGRILGLKEKRAQIEIEVGQLEEKRSELLNYRVLLYGYGKSVLEPAVRSAVRLLGFGVPEPEEYKGEWDVELSEQRSSLTSLGEVEGSEGPVDVDKYRQLLDYVQTEALEGRDHKGILFGNGYRLTAPDSPERQNQFSDHALRGARKNEFCLLPTTELFKAVCAVLENRGDEALKMRIRDSILSTVGVWTFAREPAVSGKAAGACAAASAPNESQA